MGPVKVLFVGGPAGDLPLLLKKLRNINTKSGPFAAAFVVGPLGGEGGEVAGLPLEEPASLPIYFLGAGKDGFVPAGLQAKGIKYLGRSGVTTIEGLTVAFLDGTQSRPGYNYSAADVDVLSAKLDVLEGEVDILLTCEWPKGVAGGLEAAGASAAAPPAVTHRTGVTAVAEVAVKARPRYHIAAGQDAYFARLPYANRDLGVGPRMTRFVGLAPLAGAAKSLHALALAPASELDPDALSVRPEACTPSPLEAALIAAKKRPGEDAVGEHNAGDFRWQTKKPRMQAVPINHREGVVSDPACSLVARNVAFAAGEPELLDFFEAAGRVVDMFRGTNPEGRLNSWMVVQVRGTRDLRRPSPLLRRSTYASPQEAVAALAQLNGQSIQDRAVSLEASNPREPKAPREQPTSSEGCWFCLGSSAADVALVASVGEEAYIAMDKGGIDGTHVLVVPIDHARCSAELSPGAFAEVDRYLSALSSAYAAKGLVMIAFERFLVLRKSAGGGNHAHINAIGVPRARAEGARDTFAKALSAAGLGEFVELEAGPGPSAAQSSLRAALTPPAGQSMTPEYFQVILPDGVRLLKVLQRGEPRFPLNLGREVLACLAGCQERADWKQCSRTDAETAAASDAFKEMFKEHEPSTTSA
ncbi:hypothetical protein FOA52_009081 [Chlamydomonas sp. UWO 241]|nr:hypothetical protein FOA52_009081 [Chlamydomonas sp. UWO 241]